MRADYKVGDRVRLCAEGAITKIQGKSLRDDILGITGVNGEEHFFSTDVMTVTIVTPAPTVGGVYVDGENELFLRTEHGWYSLDERMPVSEHYPSHPMRPLDTEEDAE